MTITYVIQVLQAMEDGRIQDPHYIRDPEWELSKAFRRVKRRIQRLRSRKHYELVELNRAKVSAVSRHMEEFISTFSAIRNFNLHDCEGLSGIQSFIQEGFQVDDMVTIVDTIGDLGAVNSLGYKSMTPDYGIMDNILILPKVEIDNKRFRSLDKTYISELIRKLQDYQARARQLTAGMEEIIDAAREEAAIMYDLHDYFVDGIENLKNILKEEGIDWNNYRESEKMQIGRAIQVAHLITILFPRVIDINTNEINPESRRNIRKAKEALAFRDA